MKPLFSDTSRQFEEHLIEGYRKMTPLQKLQRVVALNRALEQLARARIQRQYANIPERQMRLRLAALRLPRDVMSRVFDWDPDEQGY